MLNTYLVKCNHNFGKYDKWWELVVVAENEEEAKKINYAHPHLGSESIKNPCALLTAVDKYDETSELNHWSPDPSGLEVLLLGPSISTEKGAISGYNGGS